MLFSLFVLSHDDLGLFTLHLPGPIVSVLPLIFTMSSQSRNHQAINNRDLSIDEIAAEFRAAHSRREPGYLVSYPAPPGMLFRNKRVAFQKKQQAIATVAAIENLGASAGVELPFDLVFRKTLPLAGDEPTNSFVPDSKRVVNKSGTFVKYSDKVNTHVPEKPAASRITAPPPPPPFVRGKPKSWVPRKSKNTLASIDEFRAQFCPTCKIPTIGTVCRECGGDSSFVPPATDDDILFLAQGLDIEVTDLCQRFDQLILSPDQKRRYERICQAGFDDEVSLLVLQTLYKEVIVDNKLNCVPANDTYFVNQDLPVAAEPILAAAQSGVMSTVDAIADRFMEQIMSYIPKPLLDATGVDVVALVLNVTRMFHDGFDDYYAVGCNLFNILYPIVKAFSIDVKDFNEAQSFRDYQMYLSAFNTFVKSLENVTNIGKAAYEYMPEVLQKIMDWVVPVMWRKEREFRSLLATITAMELLSEQNCPVPDVETLDTSLLSDILRSPYVRFHPAATLVVRRLTKIRCRNDLLKRNTGCQRQQPFAVLHQSAPQVGKSTLNELEVQAFSAAIGKKCAMWRRNINTAHWDGYDPLRHNVVSFDELGQDPSTNQDSLEFIGICGPALYIPPMSCNDDTTGLIGNKGASAEPDLVLANTNVMNLRTVNVTDPNAIIQRSMIVNVRVNGDKVGLDHWVFDVTYRDVVSKDLSLNDYLRLFAKYAAEHKRRQNAVEAMAVPKDILSELREIYANIVAHPTSDAQSLLDVIGLSAHVNLSVINNIAAIGLMAYSAWSYMSTKSSLLRIAHMLVHGNEVLCEKDILLLSAYKNLDTDIYTIALLLDDKPTLKFLQSEEWAKYANDSQSRDDRKGLKRKLAGVQRTQGGSVSHDYFTGVSKSYMLFGLVRDASDVRTLSDVVRVTNINAIHWKEDKYLVPKHFFEGVAFPCKMTITDPMTDLSCNRQLVELSASRVRVHQSADLALVDISGSRFPRKRATAGKFMTNQQVLDIGKKVPAVMIGYVVDSNDKNVCTVVQREFDLNVQLNRVETYLGRTEFYFQTKTVSYELTTKNGDCGSVIMVNNDDFGSRIFAMHTFGSGRAGGGIIVTEELLSTLDAPSILPVPSEHLDQPQFAQGCEAELYLPVHTSRGTKIERTQVPLVPRKFPSDKVGPPEPVQVTIDDFGDVSTLLCDEIDAGEFVLPPPLEPAGVLSIPRAIQSCGGLKSIDMHTSAGYPYCSEGLRKPDLMNIETGELTPRLLQDIQENTAIMQVAIPNVPFVVALKDECLKPGKTCRGIEVPPLWYTIMTRQYFGSFMDMFYRGDIAWSAVGVNAESSEWNALFADLVEISDKGFDGDYKKFDKKLPVQLMLWFVQLVNTWYKTHDPNWDPEHDQMRVNIVYAMCTSGLINGRKVFFRLGGMRSGFALTVIINTFANFLIMMLLYYRGFKDDPQFLCARVRKTVLRLKLYGDDNMSSVSQLIAHAYNRITWASFVQVAFGYEVTASAKDGSNLIPLEPLLNLSFLKRGFRDINGMMWPTMDLTSMDNMICWVRRSKFSTHAAQLEMNALLCLRFAFFHGRDTYDMYVRILTPFVADLPSFDYWHRVFNSSSRDEEMSLESLILDFAMNVSLC